MFGTDTWREKLPEPFLWTSIVGIRIKQSKSEFLTEQRLATTAKQSEGA